VKFRIKVQTEDGREWWEDYAKDIPDAQQWAESTIETFNATLRPREKSRKLLAVEILDESNEKHHRWTKRTGGMSVPFRGSTVDLMFCERCGITGKKYGMSGTVKIDSKYRKKVFQECHTAIAEMGKR